MLREAKREIIGIRVTSEEKQIIKKKCKELGYTSISPCIREIIKKVLGFNDN